MEILLIACMLAYAAGTRSEQSKLGLSPAQRDILREQVRHEKAVRNIADKHGVAPPGSRASGASPRKEPPAAEPPVEPPVTLSEAFRAGYRGHTPVERVATPLGRRAGGWTARGVSWARDTGRGALREYRKRRRAEGHEDPAPVLLPLPPDVPPMPAAPPTAGTDSGKREGATLKKPGKPAGEAVEPPADDVGTPGRSPGSNGPWERRR
jgi:hypothetical protein